MQATQSLSRNADIVMEDDRQEALDRCSELLEEENFSVSWVSGPPLKGGVKPHDILATKGFHAVRVLVLLDQDVDAPETKERILASLRPLGIDRLLDIHNPLDVTPVADDAAFGESVRAFIEDPGVDCAVISNVPLTRALQTLPAGEGHAEDLARPGGFASRAIEVFRSTTKPVVVNIDSGALYDPLADHLEKAGIPVFRRADDALRFLRMYVDRMSRRV